MNDAKASTRPERAKALTFEGVLSTLEESIARAVKARDYRAVHELVAHKAVCEVLVDEGLSCVELFCQAQLRIWDCRARVVDIEREAFGRSPSSGEDEAWYSLNASDQQPQTDPLPDSELASHAHLANWADDPQENKAGASGGDTTWYIPATSEDKPSPSSPSSAPDQTGRSATGGGTEHSNTPGGPDNDKEKQTHAHYTVQKGAALGPGELPLEIWSTILSSLPVRQLHSCFLVNKALLEAASSDVVWERRCLVELDITARAENKTWKSRFQGTSLYCLFHALTVGVLKMPSRCGGIRSLSRCP